MSATAPKVIVAVPTFRRPAQLRILLDALAELQRPCDLAVLVADNDGESQQGLAVAREWGENGGGLPVRAMLVAERGLASIRNALLAAALEDADATHVAMIDDDEWPDPQWIAALLEMQQRTDADIVGGPVYPAFASPVPAVVRACRFFRPSPLPDGPVDIVWGTNNVLVTRACLEQDGCTWFDPRYGLSGGEDADFFIRQRAEGRRFAWAGRAAVHEAVPEARARLSWLLRRAFRVGNTNGRIQIQRRFRGRGPAAVTGVGFAKLMLALARLPLGVLSATSRADACCDIAEAGGMLLGAFGYRYEEYAA